MWRSTFADGDAADAVFAEVDAHAFAQADAFADSEPHALSFDGVSLADHYMTFGSWLRYSNTSELVRSSSSKLMHGCLGDTSTAERFSSISIASTVCDNEYRMEHLLTPSCPEQ